MRFPHGMIPQPGKCLKLDSSLQGLVQAAFNWNEVDNTVLVPLGFTRTFYDPCLYYRYIDGGCTLVILWVDDHRIARDRQIDVDSVYEAFKTKFSMKEMPSTKFLGHEIDMDQNKGERRIPLTGLIDETLAKYRMSDCFRRLTPAVPGSKLIRQPMGTKDVAAQSFNFRHLIGVLQWARCLAHPFIKHAVSD